MNDLMNAPRRRRIGSETQVWEPTSATSYSVTCQIPVVESKAESLTYNTINSLSSTSDQNSEMTCRDRTNEFIGAVKSLQGRQGNGLVPHQQSRKIKGLQQWTEFMRVAKLIGKDLSSTYTKLEKLAILARKKTLFDDKPLEIQELTYIIKQDINSLNKQISQLQELVRSRQQQNGRHMQSHSNSVVVSLQSKLALMSNEFKQVLEVRTENLKHQRDRREHFSQGPVSSTLPVSATSGYHHGSVLLADERSRDVTDVAINMDQVARPNNQFQSMLMVEEQDTYLQSRADTMQNIETTIVELGGIFQQLAHMVKEQEEMIQRIDANVEDVQMNVEGAHGEILKYFQSVTSNRWLMIKVFGVLIIFFILFVVFMA